MRQLLTIFISLLLFFACKKTKTPPIATDPVACLNVPTNFLKLNQNLVMNNCSEDFDSVEWDFGDGNVSTELNPTHQWNRYGLYKVSLTAFKVNRFKSTVSKNICIANQVQIDFQISLKNFKGKALTDTFTCYYSAFDSNKKVTEFINLKYPPVNNGSYKINFDLSNSYYGNNPSTKHRFKLVAKTSQGLLDSLMTDEIDIVESDSYISKTAKLNFCDVDYAINLRYQ
jgi:PKD repeat protein